MRLQCLASWLVLLAVCSPPVVWDRLSYLAVTPTYALLVAGVACQPSTGGSTLALTLATLAALLGVGCSFAVTYITFGANGGSFLPSDTKVCAALAFSRRARAGAAAGCPGQLFLRRAPACRRLCAPRPGTISCPPTHPPTCTPPAHPLLHPFHFARPRPAVLPHMQGVVIAVVGGVFAGALTVLRFRLPSIGPGLVITIFTIAVLSFAPFWYPVVKVQMAW